LAICLWYLMKILIMKRVIIAAGLLLAVGTTNQVVAQNKTTGKKTNTVTVKKTSTSSHAAKSTKASPDKIERNSVQPIIIHPEKEYMWEDGQLATPSGHDATPVGGGYAALKKDTVVRKKYED
jgi:hypothetical protein